jgi:hypothetical protein
MGAMRSEMVEVCGQQSSEASSMPLFNDFHATPRLDRGFLCSSDPAKNAFAMAGRNVKRGPSQRLLKGQVKDY